jgi:hypothetical protein
MPTIFACALLHFARGEGPNEHCLAFALHCPAQGWDTEALGASIG